MSSQQSLVIEDLLNAILDDVIATAVHGQLSAAGLAPAAEETGANSKAASAAGAPLAGTAERSSRGTAAAAADLIAPQFSGGAVCVLDASVAQQPLSAITLLKEGIDHNCDKCDAEFGLESLEADGPADSWLVEADGAAGADPSRVFCKGPSWDRFVDKMKSAGGKESESCKQQQQPRSSRSSNTGSIKEDQAAEAAAIETAAAALGSRSTSLAGQQQTSAEMAPAGPADTEQAESQAAAIEPQGSLLRRSSSRPLSGSGSSRSRPTSAEQAAAAGDAMRASFEARRTERLSSGGGSRESDSWSKSLRSRAPASTYTDGGGSQRRCGLLALHTCACARA